MVQPWDRGPRGALLLACRSEVRTWTLCSTAYTRHLRDALLAAGRQSRPGPWALPRTLCLGPWRARLPPHLDDGLLHSVLGLDAAQLVAQLGAHSSTTTRATYNNDPALDLGARSSRSILTTASSTQSWALTRSLARRRRRRRRRGRQPWTLVQLDRRLDDDEGDEQQRPGLEPGCAASPGA